MPYLAAAASPLIDRIVVCVPKRDKRLYGLALSHTTGAPQAEVLMVSGVPGRDGMPGLLSEPGVAIEDGVCIYVDSSVCYIEHDALAQLAIHKASRPFAAFSYPACVGTERTTYIQQAMGRLPSWCLKQWDGNYIDSLDFRREHPRLVELCHRTWIQDVLLYQQGQHRFPTYHMTAKDRPVACCFAFDAAQAHELFKRTDKDAEQALARATAVSTICGRAWVAQYALPEHKKHMDATDLASRYADLVPVASHESSVSAEEEIEAGAEMSLLDIHVAATASQPEPSALRFAVAAHKSDFERTVPTLVRSLVRDNGVDPSQIHVVVGGFDRPATRDFGGVRAHCVDHNSFDHTALIDILERDIPGAWWFNLHATAKAGPEFVKRIVAHGFGVEHFAVLAQGWLNMGLFSRSYLERTREYVLALKNCNKMQAILTEQMYWRFAETRAYYDWVGPHTHKGAEDVYGDGVPRQVLHMPECDLYKYQQYFITHERTQRVLAEYLKPSSEMGAESAKKSLVTKAS